MHGIAADASVRPAPGGRWRKPWRRWLPEGFRLRWIAGALAALVLLLFAWLVATAPLAEALQPIARPSVTLVTADGRPIARRGLNMDEPVRIEDLPAHVPGAFLAIEDRRFYRHAGVDMRGLLRAMVRNLRAGGVREGGSTITQQLAKMTVLSADRTYTRKLRELVVAWWIEFRLPKDEILARYLNNAYFGDRVYGLRAASLHYFNRQPEELRVEQAAMLAGLVNAPSRLAPTGNEEGARERAKLVAEAMERYGFLPEGVSAGDLPDAELEIGPVRELLPGSYFADWLFAQHPDIEEGQQGQRTVETTLDSRLQRQAEEAVARASVGGAQVALVAMRPDGRVVAMVGGKDYRETPFNRVTQARRQPGSTFKLFVYLAGLRSGMTPETMVDDSPVRMGDWEPSNYGEQYRGPITLREAFAISSNSAAVQVAEHVGRDRVIQAARDLGIASDLHGDPSLALGTSEVTLLEMTAAYAAVAGNSYPVRPRGLPVAQRSWADWLGRDRGRLDAERTWPMMLDLLWSAVNSGTGRAAALRAPTFGKTGTSSDHRDALFIGFAEDLVTGVWIGHDDNRPLGRIAGGGAPARVWRDFMSRALAAETAAAASSERAAPAAAARPRQAARQPQRAEARGKGRGKAKGRRGRRG